MTLQQLRYFLAACQYSSFAAAAESFYIAQPSLSEQIRRLEGELGVELFIRSGRRLKLTEAGRTLRPHAESVLASVELAAASVSDVRNLTGGTASLGTFGVAYHFFVADVVAAFAARHPDVKVRVIGQNTIEVCEKIRSGDLEAGLVTMPFDETGLEVKPVMTDENKFCRAGAPDDDRPVTIQELAQTRLILYDARFGWHDPTRRQLLERARAASVRLEAAIEVETFEAALDLAARGLGGTFALQSVIDEATFPDRLSTVPFDPPLYDRFALVWRKGTKLSPATRELVRLAEQQMARMDRFIHAKPNGDGKPPP